MYPTNNGDEWGRVDLDQDGHPKVNFKSTSSHPKGQPKGWPMLTSNVTVILWTTTSTQGWPSTFIGQTVVHLVNMVHTVNLVDHCLTSFFSHTHFSRHAQSSKAGLVFHIPN